MTSPLTWTAPAGNGANAIVLSIVNGSYQVSDNNKIVASQPVSTTSSVTLTGAAGSKNTFNILNTAPGGPTTVNFGVERRSGGVGQWLRRPGHPVEPGHRGLPGGRRRPGSVFSLSDLSSGTNTFDGYIINGQNEDILTGPGYTIEAINFAQVKYTSQNPSDTANLWSSSGGTGATFTSGVTNGRAYDQLFGPGGSSVEVMNSSQVKCTSENPSDVAYLISAPSGLGSIFTAHSNGSIAPDDTLRGLGYAVEAVNFNNVHSYSEDMNDVAYLIGPSGRNSNFAPIRTRKPSRVVRRPSPRSVIKTSPGPAIPAPTTDSAQSATS